MISQYKQSEKNKASGGVGVLVGVLNPLVVVKRVCIEICLQHREKHR